MKNIIIFSGIALVVLANIDDLSFDTKKEVENSKESKKEIKVAKGFKIECLNSKKLSTSNNAIILNSRTLFLRNFSKITTSKTIGGEEPIEIISTNKMNQTADELIAEDNLITENTISNEAQPLDFDIINGHAISYEFVEPATISKKEKTADERITEDNAITENNISNETLALNFSIIDKISNFKN